MRIRGPGRTMIDEGFPPLRIPKRRGGERLRRLRILLQLVAEDFGHVVKKEKTRLAVDLGREDDHDRLIRPDEELQTVARVWGFRDPASDRWIAPITVQDGLRGAELFQQFQSLGGAGPRPFRVELVDRERDRQPVEDVLLR